MGRAAARDGGAGGGGELGEETGWQQLVERCGLKAVPRKYMRAWKKIFQSEQFSKLKESELQIELDVPTSAPFSTTQTLSSLSAAFASCLSLTSQGGHAGCFQKCA